MLIEKLAEMLEITVQEAVKAYPIIRDQLMWGRVFSVVGGWLMIFCFLTIIGIVALYFFGHDPILEFEEKMSRFREKHLSKLVIFFIICFIAMVTIDVIRPFVTADLNLLEKFLK